MKTKTVLRWVFLLPIVLICMAIGDIISHLILFGTLTQIVKPYPDAPERLLLPFISGYILVYYGYKLSPSQPVYMIFAWSAFAIFGMLIFATIIWSGGTFFGTHLFFRFWGLEILLLITGVVLGFFRAMMHHALKEQ